MEGFSYREHMMVFGLTVCVGFGHRSTANSEWLRLHQTLRRIPTSGLLLNAYRCDFFAHCSTPT